MSTIRFEGVGKSYGAVRALDAVDLEVPADRLSVLFGPPRGGKSVLLKLLVGLERPDRGRILFDGVDVAALPAAERTIGYVPQSFALVPHMSVFDNVAYPLALQKVDRAEIERRVGRVAEILRITRLLGKKPSQLSGGEKQRAAIARGTLKDAGIFIFDDPLVGLDFKLRESLMDDLREMRLGLRATFLYATSDPLEALAMADRVVVMDGGRIVEAAEVEEIYHAPRRLRSAELLGFPRCNLLEGRPEGDHCVTRHGRVPLPAGHGARSVTVAVRPEHVRPAGDNEGGSTGLGGEAVVRLVENLGAECVLYLDAGGERLVTTQPSPSAAHLAIGASFPFRIDPARLMLFDAAGGGRLAPAGAEPRDA